MGMEGMPVKYKKATAPLDETARERLWATAPLFHGEETSELADLVDSFYEGRGDAGDWAIGFGSGRRDCGEVLDDVLSDSGEDLVADRIRVEVEHAVRVIGPGKDELKRLVMCWLRDKGYDAGLCKSQRDQTSRQTNRLPSGHHDYIDVFSNDEARYIVEIDLAAEFEIARPTGKYDAILRAIPKVFIGKPEVLKRLVSVMCVAAKESMRSAGMHVPPWRTREYMKEKWFGSYERSTMTLEGGAAARSGDVRIFADASNQKKFCRMEISSWDERKSSAKLTANI